MIINGEEVPPEYLDEYGGLNQAGLEKYKSGVEENKHAVIEMKEDEEPPKPVE